MPCRASRARLGCAAFLQQALFFLCHVLQQREQAFARFLERRLQGMGLRRRHAFGPAQFLAAPDERQPLVHDRAQAGKAGLLLRIVGGQHQHLQLAQGVFAPGDCGIAVDAVFRVAADAEILRVQLDQVRLRFRDGKRIEHLHGMRHPARRRVLLARQMPRAQRKQNNHPHRGGEGAQHFPCGTSESFFHMADASLKSNDVMTRV